MKLNPDIFLQAAENVFLCGGEYCCNEIRDLGWLLSNRSARAELKFFVSWFQPDPLPANAASDGWWGPINGYIDENTEARILALLLTYEIANARVLSDR